MLGVKDSITSPMTLPTARGSNILAAIWDVREGVRERERESLRDCKNKEYLGVY